MQKWLTRPAPHSPSDLAPYFHAALGNKLVGETEFRSVPETRTYPALHRRRLLDHKLLVLDPGHESLARTNAQRLPNRSGNGHAAVGVETDIDAMYCACQLLLQPCRIRMKRDTSFPRNTIWEYSEFLSSYAPRPHPCASSSTRVDRARREEVSACLDQHPQASTPQSQRLTKKSGRSTTARNALGSWPRSARPISGLLLPEQEDPRRRLPRSRGP